MNRQSFMAEVDTNRVRNLKARLDTKNSYGLCRTVFVQR